MGTRITDEHINSIIACIVYYVFPDTTHTVCVLTLKNGFTVTGESACIVPENFDADRGREVALGKAKDKVKMLEAYLMRQRIYDDAAQNIPRREPAPDPYFINAAIPTRVMVLLDNTQFHEATPILPDGTYVLKDCVVICRDVYDQMKDDLEGKE